MQEFCAMIFDLKHSRNLANRSQVQETLIQSIREYNTSYSGRLAASFLIIVGDEWQGLLHMPAEYTETINFFLRKLELPMYVGIGIGECTVFHQDLTVNQLDGPAFYKARQALKLAKEYQYTQVLIR